MLGYIGNDCCRKVGVFLGKTLFVALVYLSFPATVFSEHEANHRYLVSGHVRNPGGKALVNVAVELEHKGGQKKKVTTDGDGYYEARFHLHNKNHGEVITVKVAQNTKRTKVEFDTDDEVSFRGSTVDFGPPSSDNSPIWVFLTIASVVVLVGTVYFGLIKGKKGQSSSAKTKQKKKGKRQKK